MRIFAIIILLGSIAVGLALPAGFMEPTICGTNLIGWWSVNENTGVVVNDLSGNGNIGYASNSPSWLPGVAGSALSFKTNLSCVNVASTSSMDSVQSNSFTVSLWLFLTNAISSSGIQIIAYKGSNNLAAGTGGWFVAYRGNGGTPTLELTKTGAAVQTTVCTLPVSNWLHFSAVQNYSAGVPSNCQFYTNGALATTVTQSSAYAPSVGKEFNFGCGNENVSGCSGFGGRIDDVVVVSRALTSTDEKRLYNSRKSTHRIK